MTDVQNILYDNEYGSLKKLMDKSPTLDSFDRKVHGASATQARLYTEYKAYKEEQEEAERQSREELRTARRIIRQNILPYAIRRQFVIRHGRKILVLRDIKTGRFIARGRWNRVRQ